MGKEKKTRRPLAGRTDSGDAAEKPIKLIGSKGAGDVPQEVLAQLQMLNKGGQGGFVPPSQPVLNPEKQPRARVKSSKITVVSEDADTNSLFDQPSAPSMPPVNVPVEEEPQSHPVESQAPEPSVDTVQMRTKEKQAPVRTPFVKPTISLAAGQEHRSFPVPLPSRGLLYGGHYSKGFITVRPAITKEESVLYSQGDTLNHVNKIINGCVVNPEMDSMDLLVADRFAILIYLRIFSYGALYQVPYRCKECDKKNDTTVDLAKDLEVNYMNEDAEEPFEFDFPMSDNYVHFRLLRGTDEAEIVKRSKRLMLKSMDEGDPSNIFRLATTIVGINGHEATPDQALKFIENLLPGDSHAFNDFIEDTEGQIDTRIYRECGFCGAEQEFAMPFSAEFFRPTRKRRRRTV